MIDNLPKLKNVKNLVMRFEPSPSGPLHIGHSYPLGLNSELCRKYKGKMILRIGDTNPENIDENAYKLIEEDVKWLTKNNIFKVYVQSDRLDIYYKYGEEGLKKGFVYVCTCPGDVFRDFMSQMKPCPCRNNSANENLKRWEKMFKDYKQGDAVVRIKTSINNPNPALRDWPAFRISDKEHIKQGKKYRVWPLMNFAVAIDDHEMKVTHTVRAKDHIDNEKRQKFLYDYFKWKIPEHLYTGRINFKDLKLSTSETRQLIEGGKYDGWDDVRLPFLPALRRRGYQPEAFINYAVEVGLTQADKTTTKEEFFKIINHLNREIIDNGVKRFFFVENPRKLKLKKCPKINPEIKLHPTNKKLGSRKIMASGEFYIQDKIEYNKIYRLMHLLNFKNNEFLSKQFDKVLKARIIHWVDARNNIKAEILTDSGFVVKGVAEKNIEIMKEGEICQFERLYFARLEKKGLVYKFVYLHR